MRDNLAASAGRWRESGYHPSVGSIGFAHAAVTAVRVGLGRVRRKGDCRLAADVPPSAALREAGTIAARDTEAFVRCPTRRTMTSRRIGGDSWEGNCSRVFGARSRRRKPMGRRRTIPVLFRTAARTLQSSRWVRRISSGPLFQALVDAMCDTARSVSGLGPGSQYLGLMTGRGCPESRGGTLASRFASLARLSHFGSLRSTPSRLPILPTIRCCACSGRPRACHGSGKRSAAASW